MKMKILQVIMEVSKTHHKVVNKFFYLIIVLMFFSCGYNQEQKMIDEYHKKVIESKGEKALFISKQTVESFMLKRYEIIDIENIKKEDNISFFDSEGNIFYQVNCTKVLNDVIYIKCLNLNTLKEYETTFEINNIIDLKNKDVSSIKVFRQINKPSQE